MRSTSGWSYARAAEQELDFGEVKGQQHRQTGCRSRRRRQSQYSNVRTYYRNGPISDALVGTKQISLEQLRKVLGLESFSGAVKAHQAPPTETEFDGR